MYDKGLDMRVGAKYERLYITLEKTEWKTVKRASYLSA